MHWIIADDQTMLRADLLVKIEFEKELEDLRKSPPHKPLGSPGTRSLAVYGYFAINRADHLERHLLGRGYGSMDTAGLAVELLLRASSGPGCASHMLKAPSR